jgi:DNA polymerase V
MMSLAAGLGPKQEIYSIDESFVDLTGVPGNLTERSHKIRNRILQWVGIPCGIGIGTTKTLAKLANHVAKTAERKPGSYPEQLAQVCNLAVLTPIELESVFAATPVNEVWGVGRQISKQLIDGGVKTVLDLVRLDPAMVKRRWSVVLERTVRELQGISCVELEHSPQPKQEIACTRSFGHPCYRTIRLGRGHHRICQSCRPEAAQAKQPGWASAVFYSHQSVSTGCAVQPVNHGASAPSKLRTRR